MTTTKDPLLHVLEHALATNVTPEQHHLRPSNISISNTSQSIEPLPGGPGVWDVAVPYDCKLVALMLRGPLQGNDHGGKLGGRWLATRTAYLEASGLSLGGQSPWQSGGYPGFFNRPASSMDLSHRIFTVSGFYVALTDAYLATTGPTTRVLRMSFTNYGASYYTLSAYGEVQVLG